jgi:hypothetical protein
MKSRGWLFAVSLVLAAVFASSAFAQISGQYIEARTADVYTGPCFANSEVNLTGQEAVLAWRIDKGSWDHVALHGLAVVAVVHASATLGDPYANPLPAKTVFLVDARANEAQRAALVGFAQAQTGLLLKDIVAIESAPIRFDVGEGSRHMETRLEVANLALVSTRALAEVDEICHNEEVYYPPLAANLNHAMPAVASRSAYRGNHLGVNWSDSGRRSAFVGTFSLGGQEPDFER